MTQNTRHCKFYLLDGLERDSNKGTLYGALVVILAMLLRLINCRFIITIIIIFRPR